MSTCFITLAGVLFHCMPWYFTGKRWLLICMQHTCRLSRVQHTKHYLRASYYRAAHKVLLACSAWNIARVQYTEVHPHAAHFVSHACFDSSHDKNWRTQACSLHGSVNLDLSCTIIIYWQHTTGYKLYTYMWFNCDIVNSHAVHYIRKWTRKTLETKKMRL